MNGITTSARDPRSRGRILVADDYVVNRLVAVRFAERLGYTADVATNGWKAAGAVRAGDYDAVLIGGGMCEAADGEEALGSIRAAAGGRRIPMIAMFAIAPGGDGERRQRLPPGVDDVLHAPVRVGALARTLERWVGGEGGPATEAAVEAGVGPAETAPQRVSASATTPTPATIR